jgi:hypothetical protein
MRFPATLLAILPALTAGATWGHPGHVHGPGPVHGFSWIDLALYLAVSVAAPAAAWLVARRRNRRR